MRSIRFFLVAGILATLTLFNFIAALQGYRSSMEEAEVLFDNQLQDVARLVSQIDAPVSPGSLTLKNDIVFQRWERDELVLASAGAPPQPIAAREAGFGFANFSGYRWRTYALNSGPAWILVAERTDLRFLLAENVVLESVVPILLGIPIVGLLIFSIVSLGLRPLSLLSRELKNKVAHDFAPLHHANPTSELKQVVESLNGFLNRLGSVLEREKRFSADAAHELRTPVSALKVQLHNLRDEVGAESESYRQLQAGVERMHHLIEQLLTLSRTTPEKFAENCRVVDLYEVAQGEIARLYDQFENKNQSIELAGGKALVRGDAFALETLMDNLLSNANKYTQEGGSIVVTTATDGDNVNLSVEDNGPGIAESERERVFDRFYRSDFQPGNAATPGCGLGLTIVSQIAELHQATLDLAPSRFESGTAFRVIFNRAT